MSPFSRVFTPVLTGLALSLAVAAPAVAQEQDVADLVARLDRIENSLRQMTGAIEQLQFRNQQLEQQLRRAEENARGPQQAVSPPVQVAPRPQQTAPSGPSPVSRPVVPAVPGQRSDVFDPAQQPNAPGAPRTLGGGNAPLASGQDVIDNAQPVGAPGGREAGAPLDLSSVSSPGAAPPPRNSTVPFNTAPAPADAAPGAMASTAPPGNMPKDEYDLAYGYVLRKDYALAETTFRGFIKKYPNDAQAAEAQYWLGESLYQRQRYQDAADSFLVVVRNHDKSGKAPDALLRLGQSLAAMGQKEMACASFNEVGRKYPRASGGVKRGVEQEQKRVKC